MSSQQANADLVESAKRKASYQAVKEHFDPSMKFVGIGSGSTIAYVVEAIKEEVEKAGKPQIMFVPTGFGSRKLVTDAGLLPLDFESLPPDQGLDVAFDGTDECDEDFNLIKGGGACLFQEKLVASRAAKFVAVADFRKDAKQLLTQWTYIPIEVAPMAVNSVLASLKALGSPNPSQRLINVTEKKGPLKTDQDFYIVMAPFAPMETKSGASSTGKTSEGLDAKVWEPLELAEEIKKIVGVLEVGLFVGETGPEALKQGRLGGQKPVAVYFGMQDGTVKTRVNSP